MFRVPQFSFKFSVQAAGDYVHLNALWWWIDRWRKSTAYTDMTLEEQGAYRNLLDEAHLRNGLLPDDERILSRACGDVKKWKKVRENVLKKFRKTPEGFRNDTLDRVMSESLRRAETQRNYRERLKTRHNDSHNEPHNESDNNGNNSTDSPVPVPVLKQDLSIQEQANSNVVAATTSTTLNGSKPNGNGRHTATDARSRHPIFPGQRFVVFDWMLDDFRRLLGPANLEAFDIHAWFDTLDRAMAASTAVMMKREEQWPWLQEQLLLEAKRRKLPMLSARTTTQPRGCRHNPVCADDATHSARDMAERRIISA